jgi:hypothetical protein
MTIKLDVWIDGYHYLVVLGILGGKRNKLLPNLWCRLVHQVKNIIIIIIIIISMEDIQGNSQVLPLISRMVPVQTRFAQAKALHKVASRHASNET